MRVSDLLLSTPELRLASGDPSAEVTGVTYDSRRVKPGFAFFALPGLKVDGHDFVPAAVAKGAGTVCVNREVLVPPGVAVLVAADTRLALAGAAAAFHAHPSAKLHLTGVTGTKGKTTTTHLIRAVLEAAGHRTGMIGTVQNIVGGRPEPVVHTTPEAPELQELFARMVDAGDTHAVMEVSSHALALRRAAATAYDIALLTNIGHDHLDFHRTVDEYIAAKSMLFAGLTRGAAAIVNDDEPNAGRFVAATPPGVRITAYGLGPRAQVRAEQVELLASGARYMVKTPAGAARINLALPGRFNVYNSLAAVAAGLAAGIELPVIVRGLQGVKGVAGRFERVDAGQPFAVIVDYAHTPESLAGVLDTARELTKTSLLVVFGCGGDRDRTRRPTMGRIAAEKADMVYITSDNPRSEQPERIIDDIVAGLPAGMPATRWERNTDRASAIHAAVAKAGPGDVVLIAGKGHETYQILGETTIHFDDREVAREAMYELGYRESD